MLKFVAEWLGLVDHDLRVTLAKYGEVYPNEGGARARADYLNNQPGPFKPGSMQVEITEPGAWIVRLMKFSDQPIGVAENNPTASGEPVTQVSIKDSADYPHVKLDGETLAKPGYEPLLDVLLQMLEHAQSGKGHERHGDDVDVREQRAVQDALTLGSIQGPAYQVMKKVPEAVRLAARGDYETARRNLIGAGNYCAFAVIALDLLMGQELPVGKAPILSEQDEHALRLRMGLPHPSHHFPGQNVPCVCGVLRSEGGAYKPCTLTTAKSRPTY